LAVDDPLLKSLIEIKETQYELSVSFFLSKLTNFIFQYRKFKKDKAKKQKYRKTKPQINSPSLMLIQKELQFLK